jgi:hypothetical protein
MRPRPFDYWHSWREKSAAVFAGPASAATAEEIHWLSETIKLHPGLRLEGGKDQENQSLLKT